MLSVRRVSLLARHSRLQMSGSWHDSELDAAPVLCGCSLSASDGWRGIAAAVTSTGQLDAEIDVCYSIPPHMVEVLTVHAGLNDVLEPILYRPVLIVIFSEFPGGEGRKPQCDTSCDWPDRYG
jgi:hypothetical protein